MTRATAFFPLSALRQPAAARTTPSTPLSSWRVRLMLPLAAAGVTALLAGCSAMTSVEPTAALAGLQGKVHGGQQPVAGAAVQLYAPGTTGYGSSATLIAATTTDGLGNFTIPRPYTCPSNSLPMIVVATGGNAGAGVNNALAEVAMLGPCSGLTPTTSISISEVTTVAAAYALAPFASVAPNTTNIGTSSMNFQGLINAGAAAANLANTVTGLAPSANSTAGIVLPTAEMNTLANILASCVNSGVAGVASTTCATLFTAATPPGGSAPTDTFQAALDIALNPGNNAAALFALGTPSAPFQPTLTSAPGDFALGIIYNGGIIPTSNGTHGIDIDATGNVWVAAAGASANGKPRALYEISPAGVILNGASGYLGSVFDGPQAVAINSTGNVEVANLNTSQVLEVTPAGGAGAFSASSAASINAPMGISIDNRDLSTWVANYGSNTISHINAAGVELSGSPYAGGSLPIGIGVDGSGNIWTAASDNGGPGTLSGLTKLTPNGSGGFTSQFFSTGAGTVPFDLAIDNAGNVFTAQFFGVGKNSNAGAQVSPIGGYTSNADNEPFTLAVDGLGRVFTLNVQHSTSNPSTVTVHSNTGTLISTANASFGYSANNILPTVIFAPRGIAIDGSGNCWIAGKSPNGLFELVGIAAPVVTPISVANSPNRLGVRP